MNQVKTVEDDGWLKHVKAWESSGLSQAAYCKEDGLSFSTFKKRRSKMSNTTEKMKKANIGFHAIAMPKVSKERYESEVEVELGDGVKLKVRCYK